METPGALDIRLLLIAAAPPSRGSSSRLLRSAISPDRMIHVEVYGKRDCCLCEDVKATLLKVRRDIPFEVREIDIESAPALYEAYKERIPLVVIDGRPAFKYRVDEVALRRRLAACEGR